MKKNIYSLIAVLSVSLCSAQLSSVSQAEYFWDTDPGEGSGISVTATDGNFNSAFEKIMAAGINAPGIGMHKFSIRVKDNQGVWGPVFTNVVKVEQDPALTPTKLTQAEYFWDTDPGEGSATTLLASDGDFNSAFEKVAVNGLGAPSVGLHKFSVRVKDNQGVWGPVFTNIVTVEVTTTPTPVSLSQAEYFWDIDPGEGSGTPMIAADGNFDSAFEKVLQTAIPIVNPVGLHKFSVRVKDNQGIWGPVFTNVIYIETVLGSHDYSISKVIIYPNPVKNILNVSFDSVITIVTIHNLLGQEVARKAINANEAGIDVSGLASGTYIVKVYADQLVKIMKFIKE